MQLKMQFKEALQSAKLQEEETVFYKNAGFFFWGAGGWEWCPLNEVYDPILQYWQDAYGNAAIKISAEILSSAVI